MVSPDLRAWPVGRGSFGILSLSSWVHCGNAGPELARLLVNQEKPSIWLFRWNSWTLSVYLNFLRNTVCGPSKTHIQTVSSYLVSIHSRSSICVCLFHWQNWNSTMRMGLDTSEDAHPLRSSALSCCCSKIWTKGRLGGALGTGSGRDGTTGRKQRVVLGQFITVVRIAMMTFWDKNWTENPFGSRN